MERVMAAIVPLILALTALHAMSKRVDIYSSLTKGAGEGIRVLLRIAPSMIILLTAVSMLRASGAMDALIALAAPVLEFCGIPPECAPIVLLRPVSGSGALALGAEIMAHYGVDSLIGRTAAVMMGSTETTFYVVGVYFGAAGVSKARYTLPAALFADMVGFISACAFTRFLY